MAKFTCMPVYVYNGATKRMWIHCLTKQGQFEYSTALDGKGEVGAVEDSDEVII